jgi:hypothetical protein
MCSSHGQLSQNEPQNELSLMQQRLTNHEHRIDKVEQLLQHHIQFTRKALAIINDKVEFYALFVIM